MKAIRLERPGQYAVVDLEEARAPGPGEALVRVLRVGICGTDVSGFHGTMPFYGYPRIPGHELAVEVAAVGPGVSNVRPGDRCAVEPYLNCQTCGACRRGRSNCCETLQVLGVHTDGGLRERLVVPARKLHPSGKLSPDELALVETLGIGFHAVERGGAGAGEEILVVGAGPIGLAVLHFARIRGARPTVLDVNPRRLEFAREALGVDSTVHADGSEKEKLEGAFPLVFDATGHAGSMSRAIHFAGHGGRLVLVGVTSENVTFPDPLFHRREITILATRNSVPQDFASVLRLIEEGRVNTRPWVTHRTPMAEYVARFAEYIKPEAGMIKILVEVS